MKKLIFALLLCVGAALSALGQSNPPLTVTEPDGSPRVTGVTTLKFSNGSVSCSGKVCTVTTGGGGGSGTVTSVAQSFTGGLISVGGSPITASGTLALTVAGTSGGIPYFSSASTWASSAALAANAIVIGGGAGAAPSTTTTGTGVLTALGVNVGSAGAFVTFNGAGGTPSSLTLTNGTGLPISTGVSGLGTGVAAWLATPSSANLAAALTDKTGSGLAVFATSPTLTTPVLGVATATSINKVALTVPATSATLTIADGKTLTASNTLTFTGTDASSVAFGAGGTVAYTSNNLSAFAATTSAQLAGVLSDETGSGLAVFGTSPTLTTPTISGAISFPDDVRQTFNPGTTNAGLNVGSLAGDPSTPTNGDLWYDSTANELTARINGANVALGAGGGGGGITVGTTTITSGTNTRIPYNNAGVYGEISGFTSDGTNVTAGSGNLRATLPQITTGIRDANGNLMLGFSPTASATESITIANNTATNAVSLTATTSAAAASTQAGNGFNLTAAPAVAGATNAGAAVGGSVTITAGNAARLTSGDANGGNVNLVFGTGIGTNGREGILTLGGTTTSFAGLKTSDVFGSKFVTAKLGNNTTTNGGFVGSVFRVQSVEGNLSTVGSDWGGNGLISSGGVYSWNSASNLNSGSTDTALARSAAGVVRVSNASTGAGTFSSVAVTPSQITADQNNYAPGVGWFHRWSSDASRNVTGLSAGQDGQVIEIYNVGSDNIVLVNESASSTAANRFANSTGADLTLTAGKCAEGRYDSTSARWRMRLCN